MDFGTFEEELSLRAYILSLLIKQAKADGDFTEAEQNYLRYASNTLNLDTHDIQVIIQAPEKFKIAVPEDESKRITIMYYLLFMMNADGNIRPSEEVLCYQVGFEMGFRSEMVTNLIAVMKRYLKQHIPPSAMLDKIKPYLN